VNVPNGITVSYVTNSGVYLVVTSEFVPIVRNPELSGTNFSFSFHTRTNASYTIEYNNDLHTTTWLFLKTVPGDGSLYQCLTPAIGVTQRFFRVRQP